MQYYQPKAVIKRLFILNPHLSLTNLHDAYDEQLEKLSALIQVTLCDGFSDCPKGTAYHYHTAIRDVVDVLKDLQQEIMVRTKKSVAE